ncbi:MAG: DUF4358 domain-containing protein [Ruminococcus sp.]|nr:DUF4358 domain-containing protein [Ruminococcus sp.]
MKKLIALLCAFTTLAFAGCSTRNDDNQDTTTTAPASQGTTTTSGKEENLSAKTLFDKAKAALGEIPATVTLDEEMFKELYGEGDVEEFICEIPAMNVHATEICVVKFKKNITEDEAEKFFKKRQDSLEQTWKNYLPDQYEIVKDSKVEVRGPYALFCVGERADEAEEAFEKA